MSFIKTKSFELATYSKGNENSEKIALILPGRLDTKDYVSMQSHVKFLANLGFFALSFDPPGTWESTGGIGLFSTTNYIKAVNELIEHFGNKPTLLIGHSRGGTITILAGTNNPSVVGIIPIMATYGEPTPPDKESLETGIKISYRDLPPGNKKTSEQKKFALPISYFIDGQKYNVFETLKRCTKKKLIIYGTYDSFSTVEKVREVFKEIPQPKMIHELNTEHDYRYHPEIIEEINEVIEEFIKKYNI